MSRKIMGASMLLFASLACLSVACLNETTEGAGGGVTSRGMTVATTIAVASGSITSSGITSTASVTASVTSSNSVGSTSAATTVGATTATTVGAATVTTGVGTASGGFADPAPEEDLDTQT